MKTIVLAGGFAALLAGSALASDLGSLKDGGFQIPSAPAGRSVNWTGVYVGGQVGYGNANHHLKAGAKDSYTNPAYCSGYTGMGDDGKCYAIEVPEKHEYCHGGNVLVDHQCYSPNDFEDGALKEDASPNGTYHGAEAATLDYDTEVPSAFVPEETIVQTASAFIDGINSHGLFGGGTIGADFQKGAFVFGIFGDYNFSALETETGVSVDGTSLGTVKAEEGDSWLVAARAGYLFGPRALLYGLVGYGQTDYDYTVTIGGASDTKELTFSGLVLGAGGEYALSDNVFLGIEYQHFFGSKETLVNESWDGGSLKITDELDTDKVMARLKFKLNAFK